MPGLRLMCPICTEDFTESDDIYSTVCGHIYHLSCMRQWQSRATSCPQCRTLNPDTHKLFLNLNDEVIATAPDVAADEDFKVKLESSVDKIHELQAQLQENELNFYHLQEQYTVEQDIRKDLERRIAQSTDNDTNFLRLHAQYSESEDRAKILEEENERLTIENDYKAEELAIKTRELLALKECLNSSSGAEQSLAEECNDQLQLLKQHNKRLTIENELQSKEIDTLKEYCRTKNDQTSDSILKTNLNIVEQKLRHITGELEKEISNSTQLAIDKIKLQSAIQRMELELSASKGVQKQTFSRPTSLSYENDPNDSSYMRPLPVRRTNQTDTETKCIVIRRFPFQEVKFPLEEVVVLLAAKMDVFITKDDIIKANILKRHDGGRNIPKEVTIYVEFKTKNLKVTFLSKRGLLRKDITFKFVTINEYIDQELHALFIYANKKLRDVVFEFITCTNNTIIAKQKNRRDTECVIIYSREQVDELLKNKTEATTEVTSSSQKEDTIDECFYKI